MTLTAAQRAQLCQTCADDRTAAPGRYCPRFACLCGHPTCPAFMSYVPRPEPDPLPENVLPLTSRRTRQPPPTAWDERDEATWIDQL